MAKKSPPDETFQIFLHNLLSEYGLRMAFLRLNYTKIIFFSRCQGWFWPEIFGYWVSAALWCRHHGTGSDLYRPHGYSTRTVHVSLTWILSASMHSCGKGAFINYITQGGQSTFVMPICNKKGHCYATGKEVEGWNLGKPIFFSVHFYPFSWNFG